MAIQPGLMRDKEKKDRLAMSRTAAYTMKLTGFVL